MACESPGKNSESSKLAIVWTQREYFHKLLQDRYLTNYFTALVLTTRSSEQRLAAGFFRVYVLPRQPLSLSLEALGNYFPYGRKHMSTSLSNQMFAPMMLPDPSFKSMARSVGTWRFSGGLQGEMTFEWKEGGLYLVQHLDAEHDGRKIKGMEVVGPDRPFGAQPGPLLKSRYYDYHTGATLDYTYEPDEAGFTVWMGEKGSPSYCQAKFDEDGRTLRGHWVYPNGGYELIATKVA